VTEKKKTVTTTGFRGFAECPRHSAKPELHSAKPLPSVALGKEHSAKISSAKMSLPSAFCRALGKEKHSAKYKSEKIQKINFIRGGMHSQLMIHYAHFFQKFSISCR
jgi:hypothetical protein